MAVNFFIGWVAIVSWRTIICFVESGQKKENQLVCHTKRFDSCFRAIIGKAVPSPKVYTSMFPVMIASEPAVLSRIT
jgi:hypothetical protein